MSNEVKIKLTDAQKAKIKEATGRDLPERISGLGPGVVWAGDNRTVYYVENDPVTLLSTRVKKHVLGTDPTKDPVLYEEKDTSFYLDVDKTGDERFILIGLESTVASEMPPGVDTGTTR